MKTYTPSDAPGSLERRLSWRATKNAVFHALPGTISGGMPFLALWMKLELVAVAVFMAVSLALAVGFWLYQRWENRAIRDWSFIQWGEYVSGAVLGAAAMLTVLLVTASR